MANTTETREKLDRLQSELASRRSTTHFARAAIALLAGLLIGSAGGKVISDATTEKGNQLGAGIAFVAALLAVYAIIELVRGRGALRTELVRLEELKALRRELRVDDPPSLLPAR